MTGGFLLAVIAIVLAIIIAAPHYAKPTLAAEPTPVVGDDADAAAGMDPETLPEADEPTSRLPTKLKKYRWPVHGGQAIRYYEEHPTGRFQIDGKRIHDGILITWWEGAPVKAAHAGTVVAAGRDWFQHVGYDDPLDEIVERFDKRASKAAKESGKKPAQFPLGVVIDDGNGYYSVYTELQDLRVEVNDTVKAGQRIGGMSRAEGFQMMRYRLVRMDGPKMRVHQSDRRLGYPRAARERVDPLAVLKLDAKRMPKLMRTPPKDAPRLSDY